MGALPYLERFAGWLGRSTANLKRLGATLGAYVALSVGTYLWLAADLKTLRGAAATIAYDLSTGGSPLQYSSEIRPAFPALWFWLSLFHIVSWLIVPVLAATTIDVAYRIYEQKRLRAEKRLRRRFRNFGITRGLKGNELDDFVEQALENIEDLRKAPQKTRSR
jgi:hypothetical protein